MLDVALMIITLTAAGEPRLSVTEAVNMEACQRLSTTIVGVLTQRETQVITARCANNALALTPYVHGAVAADYRYRYRVTLLPEGAYQLEYLDSNQPCSEQTQAGDKAAIYCVTASQAPLANGR